MCSDLGSHVHAAFDDWHAAAWGWPVGYGQALGRNWMCTIDTWAAFDREGRLPLMSLALECANLPFHGAETPMSFHLPRRLSAG